MGVIAGLFNDENALSAALAQLREKGLADDIVETVDPPEPGSADPVGAVAGRRAAVPSGAALLPRGRLGELERFFERAVEGGGRLLVVDTDQPEVVAEVLERAGASRVVNEDDLET